MVFFSPITKSQLVITQVDQLLESRARRYRPPCAYNCQIEGCRRCPQLESLCRCLLDSWRCSFGMIPCLFVQGIRCHYLRSTTRLFEEVPQFNHPVRKDIFRVGVVFFSPITKSQLVITQVDQLLESRARRYRPPCAYNCQIEGCRRCPQLESLCRCLLDSWRCSFGMIPCLFVQGIRCHYLRSTTRLFEEVPQFNHLVLVGNSLVVMGSKRALHAVKRNLQLIF